MSTEEIDKIVARLALESRKPNELSPLPDLIAEAHACAVEKGWWEVDHPYKVGADARKAKAEADLPTYLCLIHSEVSEALEAYRTPNPMHDITDGSEDVWAWTRHDGKPEGILSELADVVIRVFDLVGALGMTDRFLSVLVAKMRYNRTRSHRHGGKRC